MGQGSLGGPGGRTAGWHCYFVFPSLHPGLIGNTVVSGVRRRQVSLETTGMQYENALTQGA